MPPVQTQFHHLSSIVTFPRVETSKPLLSSFTPLDPTFETYGRLTLQKPKKNMGQRWSKYQLKWWCFIPWYTAANFDGRQMERQGTTLVPLISRISSPTWRNSHRNHGFFWGKSIEVGNIHGNLLGKKYKYTSLSGTKRKLLAQENQKKRDSWFNSNFRTTELRHHNVMGRSSPPGPCKTGGRATFVRPSEVFFDF